MIIIFDLDDTLYPEIDFVKSGMHQVAHFLSDLTDKKAEDIYENLMTLLNQIGRGYVFDAYLESLGIHTKHLVARLIQIYRRHEPNIALDHRTIATLSHLRIAHRLYLVTDGNKFVQQNKIMALNLNPFFERVLITHRFGLAASKPSLKCFQIIKKEEQVTWQEMVYVGDDPNKDFVNLNKVGVHTIRRRMGRFATITLKNPYEARWQIDSMEELLPLLEKLNSKTS